MSDEQNKTEKKTLFIIDVMPFLYRGHFVFLRNPRMTTSGINTSALIGLANGLLAIPRIGLSHRSKSGNGHLEFTVGYQKGSVLKKFNDVRYTRSSPEFSVRYYHTLGFGAKAFDSVNLPEILK